MAQDGDINNHKALPATSSDSMSPGKDSNRGEESKSTSRLVVMGSIDKGKGVSKTGGEDQGRSNAAARDGRSGRRRGDRELHITMERKRRKRMNEMFTELHGLLPTLPDKDDKSSIVMGIIDYIKSLEGTLSELEKRKLEMQQARGQVGVADSIGVSSSAAGLAPTALVALEPVVLPDAGIWPTRAAPAPPVTVGTMPVGVQPWSGPNVALSLSGNDAFINVCVARRPGVLKMVMAVLEKHNINVVTSGISSDNARSMFTVHARINGATNQFGDNVSSEEIYKLAVSEIMGWLSE